VEGWKTAGDDEQNGAGRDVDVGQVEDWPVVNVEEVDDVTTGQTIQAIADGAGRDQQQADPGRGAGVATKSDDQKGEARQELHGGQQRCANPFRHGPQQAEAGVPILDVIQIEDPRQQSMRCTMLEPALGDELAAVVAPHQQNGSDHHDETQPEEIHRSCNLRHGDGIPHEPGLL